MDNMNFFMKDEKHYRNIRMKLHNAIIYKWGYSMR